MILVTGGTGYIGSQVCKVLDEKGIDFRIMSRTNGPKHIKYDLLAGDENELKEILLDYKKIIHCAWFVDRSEYLHSPRNFDWVSSSFKLANCLRDHGVDHFLSLGTCLEYKPSMDVKKVTDLTKASSNYSLAKILTNTGLNFILNKKSIPFAWCRLFHLYGGKEDDRKLFPSVSAALSQCKSMEVVNSNQKIDISDVYSVAKDIVKIANGYTGEFNLCSGNAKSIEEHIRCHFQTNILDNYISFKHSANTPNNLCGIRNVPM